MDSIKKSGAVAIDNTRQRCHLSPLQIQIYPSLLDLLHIPYSSHALNDREPSCLVVLTSHYSNNPTVSLSYPQDAHHSPPWRQHPGDTLLWLPVQGQQTICGPTDDIPESQKSRTHRLYDLPHPVARKCVRVGACAGHPHRALSAAGRGVGLEATSPGGVAAASVGKRQTGAEDHAEAD